MQRLTLLLLLPAAPATSSDTTDTTPPPPTRKRDKVENVLTRGTVDSVVVFTEYKWVGSAEENPEENELPFPAELRKVAAEERREENGK